VVYALCRTESEALAAVAKAAGDKVGDKHTTFP
jgi:hypothetical protein